MTAADAAAAEAPAASELAAVAAASSAVTDGDELGSDEVRFPSTGECQIISQYSSLLI